MNIFYIRKPSGKVRTIYAPNPEEKAALRRDLSSLNWIAEERDVSNVAHGFRRGRSPVTNALAHVGWEFTLVMDMQDFFDTVTMEHFAKGIDVPMPTPMPEDSAWRPWFPDGAARQGLPTSPAVANIAAAPMDTEICALIQKGRFGQTFCYTRYADDMTFSFDYPRVGKMLLATVPQIVAKHGFKLHPDKTRLMCATQGRRMITGVAVADKIYVPRRVKRLLRSAIHKRRTAQARGLWAWSKLKLPKNPYVKGGTAKPSAPAPPRPANSKIVRVMKRFFDLD